MLIFNYDYTSSAKAGISHDTYIQDVVLVIKEPDTIVVQYFFTQLITDQSYVHLRVILLFSVRVHFIPETVDCVKKV